MAVDPIVGRILTYAGKRRNQVSNPCITANEAIRLAGHIAELNETLRWVIADYETICAMEFPPSANWQKRIDRAKACLAISA